MHAIVVNNDIFISITFYCLFLKRHLKFVNVFIKKTPFISDFDENLRVVVKDR